MIPRVIVTSSGPVGRATAISTRHRVRKSRTAVRAGAVSVVFSLSSIEHFGSRRDIRRASAEIGRVLKAGGHAAIATECFVRRHPLRRASVDFAVRVMTFGRRRWDAGPRRRQWLDDVFTVRELHRDVVRPSGLRLMQPLDVSVSAATWENRTEIREPGHVMVPATGEHYPHLLLGVRGSWVTSVFLALEKAPA